MNAFTGRLFMLVSLLSLVACAGSNSDESQTAAPGASSGGASGTSSVEHKAVGASAAGGGGTNTTANTGTGGAKNTNNSSTAGRSASGGTGASGPAGSSSGAGANATAGASAANSGGPTSSGATPSYDDVKQWVDDYAAAHPGKDGDILAKTPSAIAADPDAQRLRSLCGAGALPVIPRLAWEYGGSDHAWINPSQSALVYCVYIPVKPSSANWQYDAAKDHVIADVSVLYPDQNPCKSESGADQIAKCIGDMTNFEILVDTASLNDGSDVGLSLAEATTELQLIVGKTMKIHLWTD